MSICICCILDVTFQDVTFGKQLLEELIIHKTHREVQRESRIMESKVSSPERRFYFYPFWTAHFGLTTFEDRSLISIYFDDDSQLSFLLRSE